MVNDLLLMLVILNPFAQMLYLSKLMNETRPREFSSIYGQASVLTFCVCLLVAFLGELLLFRIFQVTLPAMRVFGGLINLQLAYSYVMKGPEGIKLFSGNAADLAQTISLPIMVGAGVVWVSMRIGQTHPPLTAMGIIAFVLLVNGVLVMGFHSLITHLQGRAKLTVMKYFGIAMRFNAMLIGAVSIEMILGGITEFLALRDAAA